MTADKTKKLVTASLLAAMTAVATMAITVPTPTNGYIHLGDGFVILSGMLLGPLWGAAAAGLGSMLADLLLGYAAYAPATLLIKALAALLSGLLFKNLCKIKFADRSRLTASVFSGMLAGFIVTGGYFLFEAAFMGYGIGAAAGIATNLLQSGLGIAVSTLLITIISKIPAVKAMLMSQQVH